MKRFIGYAYPEEPANPSLQAMFLGTFDRASDVLAFLDQNVKQQQMLRNAMLLTFFDNVRGHHLDVLVRGRGPIDGEDVRNQLDAIDPKPYEGQPMRRYMLFALEKYESSGGMRDYLHSFDTPKACVAALEAYANGDRTELSDDWLWLDTRNDLVLFDQITMRQMEVCWQEYGEPKGIFPDYQDFLQFETKSKPK